MRGYESIGRRHICKNRYVKMSLKIERGRTLRKLARVRVLVLFLLSLFLAGCQTRQKGPPPMATVEVREDLEIAVADPLPVPPTDNATWPTNWASSWIPVASWAQLNGLEKPVLVPATPHPMLVTRIPQGTLSMRVGSRIGQ